ncbi:MAG: superoxide dismutase [bacterium]|nr:superoxide dismutase [Candidatus Sumerlaeota bacterium]
MKEKLGSRRQFLAGLAALVPATAAIPALAAAIKPDETTPSQPAALRPAVQGPFALPPLGYAFDALEPHIDAKTMSIHHDKHHAAYVNSLNKTVQGHPELCSKNIEELIRNLQSVPEDIRDGVRNFGGGHFNHSIFWEFMMPGGAKEPAGELADAINASFGGTQNLKGKFNDAGMARFGSGWVWLVTANDGKLDIMSTANQDCPLSGGKYPILCNDLWEHAYYLKYQNRRADYIGAWWNTVNWDKAAARFAAYASRHGGS